MGFVKIIDAMGGVTVNLPVDMSGLAAGEHTLDGTQALAFVRDRAGSDDFFRQQRGQLVIMAAIKNMHESSKVGAYSSRADCRASICGYKYPSLGLSQACLCHAFFSCKRIRCPTPLTAR